MSKIPSLNQISEEIKQEYSIANNAFIKRKGDLNLEIEIGDTKQPDKFYPQIKLKKWDNEVNFSVRLLDQDEGQVKTEGNKIRFEGSKRDAIFYDIPKKIFPDVQELKKAKYIKLGEVDPYDASVEDDFERFSETDKPIISTWKPNQKWISLYGRCPFEQFLYPEQIDIPVNRKFGETYGAVAYDENVFMIKIQYSGGFKNVDVDTAIKEAVIEAVKKYGITVHQDIYRPNSNDLFFKINGKYKKFLGIAQTSKSHTLFLNLGVDLNGMSKYFKDIEKDGIKKELTEIVGGLWELNPAVPFSLQDEIVQIIAQKLNWNLLEGNYSSEEQIKRNELKTILSSDKWIHNNKRDKFVESAENQNVDRAEFEIVLKENPVGNKIIFDIETKGLNFYYQPELTQEEKDGGAYRPENVVGSYAVYHKTQSKFFKTKEEAEKYKVGKAFHIYRPRIRDSVGNEAWGELNIDEENGKLIVTIPQEFLDNAVYPVYHAAGLTFGSTAEGTSEMSLVNKMIGCVASPAQDGTADSIKAWVDVYTADDWKGALYILYGDKHAETAEGKGGGSKAQEQRDFSGSPSILSAVRYIIIAGAEHTSKPVPVIYYDDSTPPPGGKEEDITYPTFPDSGVTWFSWVSRRFSILCEYTAGGTPVKIEKSLKYCITKEHAAIEKSLKYCVQTTPTKKTKSLKYEIVAVESHKIEKSLKYCVVKTPSAKTKSLKYTITTTPAKLEKSLAYYILTVPSAQKDLKYCVPTETKIEKQLKYSALPSIAIQKTLKYTVITIPTKKTKELKYSILLGTTKIEKGLIYKAVPSVKIQKDLKYTVKQTPSAKTKSLKYTIVETPTSTKKQLRYRILTTPSAKTKCLIYKVIPSIKIEKELVYKALPSISINKSLKYTVIITPTKIEKSLKYNIFLGTTKIEKGLIYDVITSTKPTKSLKYTALTEIKITKTLKYTILTTPAKAEKQLKYNIFLGTKDIQKGLIYKVRKEIAITKGLIYTVTPAKSITKPLKYCVPTTPSAKTKELKYNIFLGSTTIQKGLIYKVSPSIKVEKLLAYKVVPSIAVQLSLKYTIIATPTAKTKELKYDIFLGSTKIEKGLVYDIITQTKIEKSLRYAAVPAIAIQKSLKYTAITSIKPTKELKYAIAGESVKIEKSLSYSIFLGKQTIQKGLIYRVIVEYYIPLSLKYATKTPTKIEKTLKYVVEITPTAITKTLGYNIYLGATTIQKSLQYAVRKAIAITKGLIYKALPSIAINKTLKYCVPSTPAAKQKELRYTILTIPTALTKGLEYCVLSIPSAITKSLGYEVLTQTKIEKELKYGIILEKAITKSLKYVVITIPSAITKGLEYQVLTETKIEKGLIYEIISEQAITKSLKYCVIITPAAITKSLEYQISTTPSAIEKSLHYEVAIEIAITKLLKYCIINQPSAIITKELKYSIGGYYPYDPFEVNPYEPDSSPYVPFPT